VISASRTYHQIRAEQELARAQSATSMCARHAHLELATLHEKLARTGNGVGQSKQ